MAAQAVPQSVAKGRTTLEMDAKLPEGALSQRKPGAHISKYGTAHHGEPLTATGDKRNKKCRCGSGKKYKKCCLPLDQGFAKDQNGHYTRGANVAYEPVPSFDLGQVITGDAQNDIV